MQQGKLLWCRLAGIPLHLYNLETFHSIVKAFGFLKRVYRMTLDVENLQFARLLVEVDSLLQIPKGVLIRVGGRKSWITVVVELGEASRDVEKDPMDWTWAEVVSSYRNLCCTAEVKGRE